MVAETATDTPPLQSLYVYVTDQCNCRCRHCWIMPVEGGPSPAPTHYLPAELFEQVVLEAKPLGLQTVKWTGGEPTIHPDLPRLLHLQHEHGLRGDMETNGIEMTDALAQTMRECGINFVSLSLDGSTAELHEFVRGVPGAYERALRGFRCLQETGYQPQLIMSVMRENISDVDRLLDLAVELGAGSVKFNIVQPSSRGALIHEQGSAITVTEFIELVRRLQADRGRYPFPILSSLPLAFRSIGELLHDTLGMCRLRNTLGLLASGDYALCGVGMIEPEMVFGRVGTDALAEVWSRNRVLQRIRAEIPDQLQGICGRCVLAPVCLGTCVAQNYMSTRSLVGENWLCAEAEQAGLFPMTRLR
jgi:SynChlorMet cassette radical SAM/SPASM protein ScmF